MLAGILIAVLVVAGLTFGLPWVLEATSGDRPAEEDPAERLSHSMRILRRDVADYAERVDTTSVSTPLTRRAQLMELRMMQQGAAKIRMGVLAVLLAAFVVLAVLVGFDVVRGWMLVIPGGLLVAFPFVARFSVVTMQRHLDERAKEALSGFSEDEPTVVIEQEAGPSETVEISVDLTAPMVTSAFWDPVPVTPPANYMSKPLMPRTVRTIDLSAPVAPPSPFIPTADDPREAVAGDVDGQADTGVIAEFRPKAVGE